MDNESNLPNSSLFSNDELPVVNSPLSTKRRGLSQSALRSHRPVARPIAVGLPG